MKFRIYHFLILSLLFSLFLTYHNPNNNTSISNVSSTDTESAINTKDKISSSERANDKLKWMKKGNTEKTENPGALLDALSQIKRAPNGKSYKANYKQRELYRAIDKRRALSKVNEALPWVERGPGNVSGRSRAVIVDPDDASGNTWFVATVGGGVWKTTNAGTTWGNITPELTTLSTVCMAMSKSNPNVIYVGTGMGYGRTVDLSGNGVWKSIDKGETWTNLASTANGELLPAINRIIVDPNNENIVLVCSNGDYTSNGPNGGSRQSGIFRSADGGASWTQVYDPEPIFRSATDNRIQQIIANPSNFNEIYGAVNEVGVIKSTDAGLTWNTVADNFADPADIGYGEGTYQGISTRTELAIAPSDPTRIYASVERRRGIAKLFMSKNSGATWNEVNDTGNNPNWFSYGGANGATSYTGGWFDNTIVVHPYNENIVFVGGIEIYRIVVNPITNTRSTNVVAPVNRVHADHHDLVTIPVNEATGEFRILNANDGGVAISNDGGNTWQQINGLESTQFYGVDKMPGGNRYLGGTQDNGTWISPNDPDLNSSWWHTLGGDGFETVWNYWDQNLMIGCSQGGNYSRSIDGGNTWNALPEAKAGSSAPFISKIAGSKTDPDLLFTVGTSGVKRSDDFGESWTLTQISNNWIGWRAFDNVEMSIADPQVVWISSRLNFESFIGKKGGIHLSKDGGLTFTEISDNFPPTVLEASGISTHPYDPATAYFLFSAAGHPKILRTTDYGESFEDISGFSGLSKSNGFSGNGFPDVAVYQVLVMPYNTDIIWVGTEIGLFISEDSGLSWMLADSGLPNVGIFQMSIVDDQVIVATYGRGIWTVTLPELNEYSPPNVVLVPRLRKLVQNTNGDIEIRVNLRSAYDSTIVIIDGSNPLKLLANKSVKDTTILWPVNNNINLSVSVTAYSESKSYKTPVRSITAEPISVVETYLTNFSNESSIDDFTGSAVSVSTPNGFSNPALHFPHPYPNASEIITQLKNPIRISQSTKLKFDEIVLVEEGISNDYTDPNFFDYVIVEGSNDGATWKPLLDGYDSREYDPWLLRYNSNFRGQNSQAVADESLFRSREININETFNNGETIFIRFRIHADPLAYGWGWVIDNLVIDSEVSNVDIAESLPSSYELLQNYPNPFNPVTNINYALPIKSNVVIKVYDILGKEIVTLIDREESAGRYEILFDGSNYSSGIYFYQIITDNFTDIKKMTLLK